MSSDDKFKSLALLCTFGSANQLIVYHFFLLRCIMHMLLWFSDWSEYFYETTSHTHYTFRWTNAIETGHERTTIARIHTCLSKCFREKKNYIFFAWIIELLTFFLPLLLKWCPCVSAQARSKFVEWASALDSNSFLTFCLFILSSSLYTLFLCAMCERERDFPVSDNW